MSFSYSSFTDPIVHDGLSMHSTVSCTDSESELEADSSKSKSSFRATDGMTTCGVDCDVDSVYESGVN